MQERGWAIGDTVMVRGGHWTIEGEEVWPGCTAIRLAPGDADSQARTLLWPFDRPARIARTPAARVVRIRRWAHELRRHTASLTPSGGATACWRAPVRLLPYQLEPLLAVIRYGATRLLLADAVGLGKTIQAGLILLELSARAEGFRGLVLVPASLRYQWADELQSQLALAPVQADAAWLRAAAMERPPEVNPWSLPGVYIASIDFAKRAEVLRSLEQVSWDLVVVDEAHLATPASDRRAAAHVIATRSRRTVLLTATPGLGDQVGFGALCGIGRLDPHEPPIVLFRRTRPEVTQGAPRRSVLLAVQPTTAEQRMHDLLEQYTDAVWHEAARRRDPHARLTAILLRKRALSSAASLAASIERRMTLLDAAAPAVEAQILLPLWDEDPLDDGVDDVCLAAPGLPDAWQEHRWLARVAEAARIAARAESKSRRLLRWLRRVQEPVIVFTEYRDTLVRLEALIRGAGRPLVVLHGGLDRRERVKVQQRFNGGGLSLLATDAAAEGLNLHHHCRIVLHYELPWRPARIEQRAGRVDRLGQTRRVHELALVAKHTAERLVLAPLAARASRARAAGEISSGLLDSMAESAVAEMVMDRTLTIPEAPAQTADDLARPDARRMDLRAEAQEEADRLRGRRLVNGPRARTRRNGSRRRATLVSRLERGCAGLEPGVILVCDLTLADSAGRRVHAEPAVFSLITADGDGDPSAASMRRLVDRIRAGVESPGGAAHAHLARTLGAVLDRVAPLHLECIEQLRQRELALAGVTRSSSQAGVQPGLFDARAVRDLSRREAALGAWVHEVDARIRALEQGCRLAAVSELVAVLVVRGPSGADSQRGPAGRGPGSPADQRTGRGR